jgi:S-adenosylmethionine:tRNA ribosyltransferase-isomerase
MTLSSDFDYDLPESLIAQSPVEPRDSSRLLILRRATGSVEHRVFREIQEYFQRGDLLVLNQTRVIPARLFARKRTGGRVELLLLRKRDSQTWRVLAGGKGLSAGTTLDVEGGPRVRIMEDLGGAQRLVEFTEPIEAFLPRVGHVPLPPYIHQELQDPDRYQTVYARSPGSAAAPTAGLHFTPGLLSELQGRGVALAYVTLHVGLDTFAPVTERDASEHQIHTEWCDVPLDTVNLINQTRENHGRVIAVGTTTVRTLETAARHSYLGRFPRIAPFAGDTDLYILPGFAFRLVDAMVTNFHLPRSTLLMLVSAFAGRERVLETYEIAKREGYRFYSFGDAMLII